MFPAAFDYRAPNSLDEAMGLLRDGRAGKVVLVPWGLTA